jgi:hypothetical protein
MLVLRQFVLVTGLVLLGWIGVRAGWRALASDDTQVRLVLADMALGFDDGDVGPVLDGLASDFQDESSGAVRSDVRGVLAQLFFTEIDPKTKRFRLRVDLGDLDALPVEIQETDPPRVELDLAPRFYKRVGETEELFWDARMHVVLEERDGSWLVVHTSRVNHYDRGSMR